MCPKRGIFWRPEPVAKEKYNVKTSKSDITGVFEKVISLNCLLNPQREIFAFMDSDNQ